MELPRCLEPIRKSLGARFQGYLARHSTPWGWPGTWFPALAHSGEEAAAADFSDRHLVRRGHGAGIFPDPRQPDIAKGTS